MNIEKITYLKNFFEELYDEDFKLKDKTRLVDFNKEIEEVGISSKLSPKEIELKLQQLYEILGKKQDPLTKTAWDKDESEQFTKEAEKRDADIKETRDNQTKAVEDFIKRNQEQIAKAQTVQDKLKDKVVYAKVVLPNPLLLDDVEQKDLTTLREYAQGDEITRTKLIDDLAKQIEIKIENVPEDQKVLIARTTAVEIVEKLAKPEVVIETQIQSAILNTIAENKTPVVSTILQKNDELLVVAKNGATLIALESRNKALSTEAVIKNLFGPKLAVAINGYSLEQIQIILSEIKIEGQTTHQINLGDLNQNYVQQLEHQNSVLNSAREFGIDKSQTFFTGQARTYIAKKMASMPAGSVIKKAYSDPIVQSIFARYGLANPVVWETVGQSQFIGLAMKFAPETAGPLLNIAGRIVGKEFVKPVVAKVATDVGVKVGLGALLVKGAAAIGVSLGVFTAGISTLVTAAIMAIGKAINWPKVKKFFSQYVLPVVVGGGLIMFGAPLAGLIAGGLLFGVTRGATLAGIGVGIFNFFGIIGRSIGIAIATPVIVTLLVLPPLVAFIMLVINNSAYVVPPSPYSSTSINPYIEVTKTADPSGPFENSDLPLTITYTITVRAKRDALTNISFKDVCKVVQEASTAPCNTASHNVPDSISPSSPYVITYTNSYSVFTTDALVIDTFTVTATAGDNGEQSAGATASIRIGNPPNQCFNVVESTFPPDGYTNVMSAISTLQTDHNGYASKICASLGGGSVDIVYGGSNGDLWGYWSDGKVTLYRKGVANEPDAKYIIYHELAHVLATFAEDWYDQYTSYPGIKNEPYPYCFYDYPDKTGVWPFSERFAEAVAFYAHDPCGNFEQRNPSHNQFMNDVLFK